jgi:hemolysin III
VKPRLRGVSHRWAFFASLFTGVALILVAPTKRAVAAAMVYALSLSALFGVSAFYHEVTWSVPVRRWMRRLDHSMILLLIAGTYTPFGDWYSRGRSRSSYSPWCGAVRSWEWR